MYNLKKIRVNKGLTMKNLAKQIGVAESTISLYENGKRQPDHETLLRLADFFKVTTDYLLGREVDRNVTANLFDRNVVKIKIFGVVPAGIPIEMIEEAIDEEEIPAEWLKGGQQYFGLKIKGDSMEPEMKNEDIAIIKMQPSANNGDYCVISINGYDATLKKIRITENGLLLIPLNSKYEPVFYTNEQVNSLPIQILGKVIEIRRSLK